MPTGLKPNEEAVTTKAMEGGGYYNRHSTFQAAGIELVLPLFEKAARAIPVETQSRAPIVIADYGSSQGRNSMRPMRIAIETLRARIDAERPIEVVHTDLPSNDFASLFTTLQEDGDSYLAGQAAVFPSAIGRNYFEPIMPAGRVRLGWNSWTLQWMSRNPVEVPDHVYARLSASRSARDAVTRQQAEDWENFLAARSFEMAAGAKLVSLFPGQTPEVHGWDWILGELWTAAMDMASDGLLSSEDLLRLTIPIAGRWTDQIKAPFLAGSFCGLSLEYATVIEAPDPFWNEFVDTKDAGQLGRRWAGMLRAGFGPITAAAFASRPNADLLVDELFRRFESRVTKAPQRNQHFLAVAVICKTGD